MLMMNIIYPTVHYIYVMTLLVACYPLQKLTFVIRTCTTCTMMQELTMPLLHTNIKCGHC